LAVLAVITSYGWAQDVKPTVTNAGDLPVNVGESVRIETVEATSVALADPSIADAVVTSKKEILVNGKKAGVTTLNVYEATGAQKVYRIVVSEGEYPSKTIKDAISLPDVRPRVVGNSVILEGTVANDREMERAMTIAGAYREKVVNLLEVMNPVQVRIRIQVADVRIAAVKNKGLEYPDSVAYAANFGMIDSTVFPIPHGFASQSSGNLQSPNITSGGGSSTFTVQSPPPLSAKLNMLERNGDLRILAEPTLVTLSGKEASFLAGGEFPVVIALQNSFSVEFKEFGIRMKIKPTVDSKENINTTINTELSAIDPTLSVSSSTAGGGINIPGLTSRKASTTLQVKSGQTVMISGLLDHETTENLRKVPGIGNIPILGLLFTSKSKDQTDRELIFLATFDLVRNPTAEAQAAPTSDTMKKLLSEPKFKSGEEELKRAHGKGN
jgi:pilus assembly protein CpaC